MNIVNWTDEEINYLKENYGTYRRDYFVKYFNKTTSQVQIMINKLGIKKNKDHRAWTESEIAILSKNYPIYGSEKCASIIGVSRLQIRQKATELKIKGHLRKILPAKDGYKVCRRCMTEQILTSLKVLDSQRYFQLNQCFGR